jgi:uncharacterized Zn-binding protein involved in type VI secretion
MARRAIVRYGDRTTHGGTVVSADPTYSIHGKNVARVGDKVDCPRCGGTFAIVTGAPTASSGQQIARQDDTTSCGARLIASQGTATIDDGTGSAAAAATTAAPALLAAAVASAAAALPTRPPEQPPAQPAGDEGHAIRFQALDPGTGEPAADCVYLLTREDGTQHGGVTDAEGYTEVVDTAHPEQIGIHFMFRSPKGDAITREDLAV